MSDWTPTREQVEAAAFAIADSEACGSCAGPAPCMQCTEDARAMLAAVGPAIVAEAEARGARRAAEQIAAALRVEMRRHDSAQVGFSAVGDAYAEAARIAQSLTPP